MSLERHLSRTPDDGEACLKLAVRLERDDAGLESTLARLVRVAVAADDVADHRAHAAGLEREHAVLSRLEPAWRGSPLLATLNEDLTLQRALASSQAAVR